MTYTAKLDILHPVARSSFAKDLRTKDRRAKPKITRAVQQASYSNSVRNNPNPKTQKPYAVNPKPSWLPASLLQQSACSFVICQASPMSWGPFGHNIGALIIRIWIWGPSYYSYHSYNKEPPKIV